MNKLYLTLLAIPLLLWNCKGFDERTRFDVTYVNRVTFDPSVVTDSVGTLVSDTLILDFAQDLKDHDSRPGKVEMVRMTSFSVEIDKLKSPDAQNFNFLQSIDFYQIGDGNNGDVIKVASTNKIPKDVTFFEISILFELDKDLVKLLTNDTSLYRVVYRTKSPPEKKTVIKLASKYEVDTRKLGI